MQKLHVGQAVALPVGGGAAVYETREAVTLHATGRVDGVTKQTIPRHLVTNYTSHHRASVHAHADLNKQYRGIVSPTTQAITEPVCMPTRIYNFTTICILA